MYFSLLASLSQNPPPPAPTHHHPSFSHWCKWQKKRANCLETRGVSLSASDRRRKAVWKGFVGSCGSGAGRVSHFFPMRLHRVSAASLTFQSCPQSHGASACLCGVLSQDTCVCVLFFLFFFFYILRIPCDCGVSDGLSGTQQVLLQILRTTGFAFPDVVFWGGFWWVFLHISVANWSNKR